MGPGKLYQDLQNLLHDLNVVSQISQLIVSLKGNYQVINKAGFIFQIYSCCEVVSLSLPRICARHSLVSCVKSIIIFTSIISFTVNCLALYVDYNCLSNLFFFIVLSIGEYSKCLHLFSS